jgi:hypothetical protein
VPGTVERVWRHRPLADARRPVVERQLDCPGGALDNRRMTISTRHIWAAYGLVAAAMLVTYSTVDPEQLYHVSGRGLTGGLSRVLVDTNFPVALVAAPLAVLAATRLGTRAARVAGGFSAALCAVVVVPGVVSQSNLDAKWVNLVPALGVAVALALELRAEPGRIVVGRGTVAACLALAAASLVWIAAELGFHQTFGIFLAGKIWHGHAAVHLGHHHGLDGTMLAATALVLGRVPRSLGGRAYFALMLAYGLVNAAQDAWTEQVVKRGWTTHAIPDALHPTVSVVWLVIVLLALSFLAAGALAGTAQRAPLASQ